MRSFLNWRRGQVKGEGAGEEKEAGEGVEQVKGRRQREGEEEVIGGGQVEGRRSDTYRDQFRGDNPLSCHHTEGLSS